ncbi:predicted protein [Naegleria gruberi]|uniref:Predicted protein n=1 Tax=Naegleria gruberi TaxID=5762 RepID=D2VF40_NAEGR|nr:uncharacterized protein NAEGRDRAFT_49024 [Naegleria gruberi]EFC44616.1 predicted protein [Naegleria gruberi]|eukprot:XP_002677360.1 predicted protein [Naegleria gruberi strain NEG-M]
MYNPVAEEIPYNIEEEEPSIPPPSSENTFNYQSNLNDHQSITSSGSTSHSNSIDFEARSDKSNNAPEFRYGRKEMNIRVNNLLLNQSIDYECIPQVVREWINQDQLRRFECNNSNNNNNSKIEENGKDWSCLENLPQDVKFEIIDFIPTFSMRRDLNIKLSDRETDEYIVDEEAVIGYIDEMNQVLQWKERRMEQCLIVRDVPIKTMHKMRVISKEYAKRMKFKLMTLSHLDLPFALSKIGLCYFASFLKAQQLYLDKKIDENGEDFLIYKEMPYINRELDEEIEEIDDALNEVDNFRTLYEASPLELVMFEYAEPDENLLPNSLVEFVGSNIVVKSVKTTRKPNIIELIFATCKSLQSFVSDSRVLVHHSLPSLEHWTCAFFYGGDYHFESEIEKICGVAPNIKTIDMIFTAERQRNFKQEFLDNIDIGEDTKLIVDGFVNKIIPPSSGKTEREVNITITHLESSDVNTIMKYMEYFRPPTSDCYYLNDLIFSQRYLTLEERKNLAENLFTREDERFPIERLRFDQHSSYSQEDAMDMFAYIIYLSNEYQNGFLFNLVTYLNEQVVDDALEYGWKPAKWDELLLLKSNFTVSQVEKLLQLIRCEYQNDVNFFKYVRLLLCKVYSERYSFAATDKSLVRGLTNYLRKNKFNSSFMKVLFKPSQLCLSKDYFPIIKYATILIPNIIAVSSDVVSFVSLLDFYPDEYWNLQNENGDNILHIFLLSREPGSENELLALDKIIRKHPELLNMLNHQNRSPVHIAFSTEDSGIIRLFSLYDINLEEKDCLGKTPLDYLTDDSLRDYFE